VIFHTTEIADALPFPTPTSNTHLPLYRDFHSLSIPALPVQLVFVEAKLSQPKGK